ncbi:MAG: 3-oxoadipate--succinyl-CoA transferase subunit B [Rhodospirillaceae bacterium]|mgnify:CR=1 FL=1|nr:3-oxoadipate--succinyl-CoA transferase subunit B [Rhodospirillaceae bacterium]|tara:strand:- start:1044 stop:1823 length:780 start_codon:yes stop_codon:yes gene_type:complete
MHEVNYTTDEMMTIAASRKLENGQVCFVGIGLPSAAANLARLTHAPDIILIYESGTLQTEPNVLPLSIGDSELSENALTNVSVPEMFRYWLQGGHIGLGFLGAAQIDRFANINSTIIGGYQKPEVRLPGAGGAPEIATHCHEIFIIIRQSKRNFVEKLDFITSFGHGKGNGNRKELGIKTLGPTRVITDLCILEPNTETFELTVTAIHPGVNRKMILDSTGWPIQFAENVELSPAPTESELSALRNLQNKSLESHFHET